LKQRSPANCRDPPPATGTRLLPPAVGARSAQQAGTLTTAAQCPPPLTHVPWPPPRWYPPPRPDVQAVDRTPAPGNGGKHPQDPPADSGGCARCVTRGVSTIPPHKHVPTQARLQRRAGAGVVGARTGVMHGACVAVALSRWSPTAVGGSMQCCKCKGTVVVAGAGAVNARGLGQACVGAALPLDALQSLSRWPRRW